MSEAWRFVAWRENKYSRRLCSSPEQISPFYAAFTPMRACGRVIFPSSTTLLFPSSVFIGKCCSGADAFFSRIRTYADPGSFKLSAPSPGDLRVLFLFTAVLIEG